MRFHPYDPSDCPPPAPIEVADKTAALELPWVQGFTRPPNFDRFTWSKFGPHGRQLLLAAHYIGSVRWGYGLSEGSIMVGSLDALKEQ